MMKYKLTFMNNKKIYKNLESLLEILEIVMELYFWKLHLVFKYYYFKIVKTFQFQFNKIRLEQIIYQMFRSFC